MRNKKAAPQVIEYLQMVRKVRGKPPKGFAYNGMEDLLLKEGRVFSPSPLPTGMRRGRMKECFRNAAEAALWLDGVEGWVYTEGVALVEGLIPVQHAWLTRGNEAIDLTWTDGTEYVGIPIDNELLSYVMLARRVYGVLDDWQNGYPTLRHKWNPQVLAEFYKNLKSSR